MAGFIAHRLKNYVLEGIVILIALAHQFTERVIQYPMSWFDNYGDDLLAVPFISSCVLLMENFLIYHQHHRKHSFLQLLFIFILISLLFEFIIPHYKSGYTRDTLDILFYFIGFISYYSIKKILTE